MVNFFILHYLLALLPLYFEWTQTLRFKKSLYANIFGWLCCASLTSPTSPSLVQEVALRKHFWMVVLCRAACVRALFGLTIKRVRPVADMAGAVCLWAGSC